MEEFPGGSSRFIDSRDRWMGGQTAGEGVTWAFAICE